MKRISDKLPAPSKYSALCSDVKTGSTLMQKEIEAINRNEAEARAYLNCVKIIGKKDDLMVSVDRIK